MEFHSLFHFNKGAVYGDRHLYELHVDIVQALKSFINLHYHNKMAGDTRDPSNSSNPTPRGPPPGENVPPSHITSGTPKVYEIFNAPPQPPPSANALPDGSGQNTAGAHQPAPKFTDIVKTVRIEDFAQVYMYPCVRESLLMGIGGGFGMGGVRALWGGTFAILGLSTCWQKQV